MVGGDILLDLDYQEDSSAETDMNLVMAEGGGLIEIQGTAEQRPFSREQLDRMVEVAGAAIGRINQLQRQVLEA